MAFSLEIVVAVVVFFFFLYLVLQHFISWLEVLFKYRIYMQADEAEQ